MPYLPLGANSQPLLLPTLAGDVCGLQHRERKISRSILPLFLSGRDASDLVQRAAFKVSCKKNVRMSKCKIWRSMPTRSENCISTLAEIVVAFFGAGASAAAFFAPFFAMLIDRVFGSQGTCKVKALNASWSRRMRASMQLVHNALARTD